MRIEGITPGQVEVLDALWECDTPEDLHNYMEDKSDEELVEISVLRELLALAYIDEQVELMNSFPFAENILNQISN